MRVLRFIRPHEFEDNFEFVDGRWRVKFPELPDVEVNLSEDVNNSLSLGTDNNIYLNKLKLFAHALVQDNENQKIHLYRYPAMLEFDIEQATLVSSIDMLELNGIFDDISITDATVTFMDAQTDTELTLDTNSFQKVTSLVSSDTVQVARDENISTLSVKLDPSVDNLLQDTPDGLMLDKNIVASRTGIGLTHSLDILQNVEGDITHLTHTINDSSIDIPVTQVHGLDGRPLFVLPSKLNGLLSSNPSSLPVEMK